MQFLIKAYDGPNMLDKRMAVRPAHLEGMKKLQAALDWAAWSEVYLAISARG